jgi:restriction endonuclease S subunit
MPVPLPSIAEQQRIAAELKEQMASVEKASESAEEELQTINALLVVLLRRAFSGEL